MTFMKFAWRRNEYTFKSRTLVEPLEKTRLLRQARGESVLKSVSQTTANSKANPTCECLATSSERFFAGLRFPRKAVVM
jgi:hypothetical protein